MDQSTNVSLSISLDISCFCVSIFKINKKRNALFQIPTQKKPIKQTQKMQTRMDNEENQNEIEEETKWQECPRCHDRFVSETAQYCGRCGHSLAVTTNARCNAPCCTSCVDYIQSCCNGCGFTTTDMEACYCGDCGSKLDFYSLDHTI